MSGFVGILNLDGAPVDPVLLNHMTHYLSFCGPDRQETWLKGAVGFGHTLLRTTFEAEHEQQPFTLDGEVWITADARVDGRKELLAQLQAKGCVITIDRPDVEFILHAYHVWGEKCLDHLIGDFAFAIWDGRQQQLFCGRDHWGVKPFFYARVGNCLVVSNVLNCVRIHPAVSDELNDLFIGDFLLFGASQEFDNSAFADIQRLAPAHYLTCAENKFAIQAYWSLPTELPSIFYKRADDYIENFRELLHAAVADRLRTDRIAAEMSGGLDSTAVVATALAIGSKQSKKIDLQAFTVVYDHLIPDQERYYAQIAADALGIPIHFIIGDKHEPFAGQQPPAPPQPEPIHAPTHSIYTHYMTCMSQQSRVALTGWDGDTILNEAVGPQFGSLLRRMQWRRAAIFAGQYLRSQRSLPPIGFRTWLQHRRSKLSHQSLGLTWLNQAFVHSLQLQERWQQVNQRTESSHPIRPRAYTILTSPLWFQLFEGYQIDRSHVQVEMRHPLADLRLVLYALAIPLLPWNINKHVLRLSMKGILPERVRQRAKTPLAGDPLTQWMRDATVQWIDEFTPTMTLERYVERTKISQVVGGQAIDQVWLNLRPLSLNCWLDNGSTSKPAFN